MSYDVVMDIRTIMIVLTLCGWTSAALLYVLHRRGYDVPGLVFWFRGHLVQAVSIGLLALRGLAPDWLSIYVANAFRILAPLLVLEGLRLFLGKAFLRKRRSVVLALLGYWIFYSWLYFFGASLSQRYIVSTAIILLIRCALFREFWQAQRGGKRPILRFMAGTYLFVALGLALRILYEFHAPSRGSLIASGWPTAAHGLLLIFEILVVTVGMALMVVERLHGRVKALESFLPICAYCKKVRDGEGTWTQIEVYLAARDRARFSHGVCPDCESRLMEEMGETP